MTKETESLSASHASVRVLDPQGVVRFETDDVQAAMAKVAKLAAPNLSSGTPRWYEAGWRIVND